MFAKSSVTSIRTKPLCAELLAHRSITAVEFSQIPRRSRRLSRDELRQPCRARRSGADRASRKTIGREASRLEGLRLRRGGAMRVSARIGEARRAAEAALDALKARVNQLCTDAVCGSASKSVSGFIRSFLASSIENEHGVFLIGDSLFRSRQWRPRLLVAAEELCAALLVKRTSDAILRRTIA